MVLNSDSDKCTIQDSYQLWFCTVILRSLPFKIHISFAPNVFSSSFEEHLFIETAEIYGTRYTDIKDGFGRNFAASSTVQETHLIGQTKKCKSVFVLSATVSRYWQVPEMKEFCKYQKIQFCWVLFQFSEVNRVNLTSHVKWFS